MPFDHAVPARCTRLAAAAKDWTLLNMCVAQLYIASLVCLLGKCKQLCFDSDLAHRHGDVEATEDFLAIGKDVNMVDADQRTPLHYAVAYAQHEVFDLLVGAGANLNVVVGPCSASKTHLPAIAVQAEAQQGKAQ